MTIVVLPSVFRPYITSVQTMKLDPTHGALPVSIPRAAKLPTDLAALQSAGPDRWVAKLHSAAGRERTAYIHSLISDALTGR